MGTTVIRSILPFDVDDVGERLACDVLTVNELQFVCVKENTFAFFEVHIGMVFAFGLGGLGRGAG